MTETYDSQGRIPDGDLMTAEALGSEGLYTLRGNTLVHGAESIHLTPTELTILTKLYRHKGEATLKQLIPQGKKPLLGVFVEFKRSWTALVDKLESTDEFSGLLIDVDTPEGVIYLMDIDSIDVEADESIKIMMNSVPMPLNHKRSHNVIEHPDTSFVSTPLNGVAQEKDFMLSYKFILHGENGFDQTKLRPELVQQAWWDILAKHGSEIDEIIRERAGEILRNAKRGSTSKSIEAKTTDMPTVKPKTLQSSEQDEDRNELEITYAMSVDPRYIELSTHGICTDGDPEAFFPEKGGSTREAKRMCSRCALSAMCLDLAIDYEQRFGIWGGYSERERRRLLKLST